MLGKTYHIYNQFLIHLKETAISYGVALDSKIIHLEFELGAIEDFKIEFPGAKINGCHFHFLSAI